MYPYLASQIEDSYLREGGRELELGPFSGGISFELAARHPDMRCTIADDNRGYLAYLKQRIDAHGLAARFEIVESPLDRLPFAGAGFDLVILRGAFFFIMDKPGILAEIYRVLAPGGLAFVGGGYGRGMPQKEIDAIADESRVLNDRLGRRRVTIEQLKSLVEAQNLTGHTRIAEEGGVWLEIRKPVSVSEKAANNLGEALGIRGGDVISIVGGGGKTSLMYALAKELSSAGKKVITTTTTRIMPPAESESPCLVAEEDEEKVISRLADELKRHAHVTAARLRSPDGKLKGLAPETIDRLAELRLADYIINEADGAARKPIKAPNATEPVIPASTSLVVAVVGMDALGKPLTPEIAFRPELITRLTGRAAGSEITPSVIAMLITDRHGIIQNTPQRARIAPFLNKTEVASDAEVAALAGEILSRRHSQIERVAAGSLASHAKQLRVFRA